MVRTVNTTQVMANWLIGREIMEEERRGKRRANYGAQLFQDFRPSAGINWVELKLLEKTCDFTKMFLPKHYGLWFHGASSHNIVWLSTAIDQRFAV